ncbi:MAG: PDZ domain-containing protein [Ruminococcus sp.]|nr:PDZ domain-containing protein [Ruminococcus sp.]
MGDIMELTNKIINSFLCLSAAAAIGAGCTYLYNKKKIEDSEKYKLVSECRDILEDNDVKFPEGVDEEVAVLNGYLNAYNDDYTFYLPPKSADESYINAINNVSCLITCGYSIGLSEDNEVYVANVTAGSIAEKQGLKTGDVILAVDGEYFAEKGISPTALSLSGKDGTTMHLVLRREGKLMELDFLRSNDEDLMRGNVDCKLMGNIAYTRVYNFGRTTSAEFGAEPMDMIKNAKGIVLDLRDNGGGQMGEAVQLADYFVGEASLQKNYYTGKTETLKTSDSSGDIDKPVVVLINEKTMSAAEIATAFLKQYGKDVKLVGQKTFGKGIFQLEEELSDGGKLHYTAGTYTVGDWECYQGKGIEPDVAVEMDPSYIGTDKDVQLKKALELLG